MSTDKQTIRLAAGALGFGALAAALGTCCVAPWAVGLVGVSGAVTLARFARVQPYLLIAAAVLLAVAFFWAYRPAPACADGTCVTASRRKLRWIVWIAALIVAGLAFVALMPWLFFNI